MRTIIRKWFWAWEFDEEEQWLNDMAKLGKVLVSVRYVTYEFEDSAPGEYVIRLEMLENAPCSDAGRQYVSFVEETGAEYIGRMMRWVYFRKKIADGPFELHGDNATRRKHLQRILRLLIPLGVINLGNCLYNLIIGIGLNSAFNVGCAVLCGVVTALLARGYVRLNEKKKQLEKDAQLFE